MKVGRIKKNKINLSPFSLCGVGCKEVQYEFENDKKSFFIEITIKCSTVCYDIEKKFLK